jgi:hypothetical protein
VDPDDSVDNRAGTSLMERSLPGRSGENKPTASRHGKIRPVELRGETAAIVLHRLAYDLVSISTPEPVRER